MKSYETCTTVNGSGEIHVSGIPFKAGTEVEVTISPKRSSPQAGRVAEDMFGEMLPYMVDVPNVDDSRDAIYTRMDGE